MQHQWTVKDGCPKMWFRAECPNCKATYWNLCGVKVFNPEGPLPEMPPPCEAPEVEDIPQEG